jgi:hypothetical protein
MNSRDSLPMLALVYFRWITEAEFRLRFCLFCIFNLGALFVSCWNDLGLWYQVVTEAWISKTYFVTALNIGTGIVLC